MNAAFLLVTTAMLAAGDTGCATCGTTCATCATSGPKLLDKLRALCQKTSCDTCAAPKPAPCPCPAPAPKCNTCDTCKSGPSLLEKLKACFHKDKCDTCASGACSTCATAAPAAVPAAPAGEAIPAAPKKMPNPVGTEIPGREVRIFTPSQAPLAPAIQSNAAQMPAAIAPSFQSDNLRSPF